MASPSMASTSAPSCGLGLGSPISIPMPARPELGARGLANDMWTHQQHRNVTSKYSSSFERVLLQDSCHAQEGDNCVIRTTCE